MVYKRYIKKRVDGKVVTFGPYYYESYRDSEGKVKTRYVSGPENFNEKSNVTKKNIRKFIFLVPFLMLILFFGIFVYNQPSFSQKISLFGEKIVSPLIGFVVEGGEEVSSESISEPSQESESFDLSGLEEASPVEETNEVSVEENPISEIQEEISGEIIPESNEIEQTDNSESNTDTSNGSSELQNNSVSDEIINESIILEENQTEINLIEINLIENFTSNEEFEIPVENNSELDLIIQNETLVNLTEVNITIVNETLIVNISSNITLDATTSNDKIILGKPVKWQKKITLNSETGEIDNLTLELPSLAGNVSVKKINKNTNEETELKIKTTNEKEIEEIDPVKEEINEENSEKFFPGIFDFFLNFVGRMTGNFIDNSVSINENVTVEIKEKILDEEEVIVEYYTEPPYSEEKILENKKDITIVGPEEVHYQEVLAFTEIHFNATSEMIKLYWIVNETKLETNFVDYDDNLDGFVDYIEWIVPHLSNQSYELSINVLNVQSYPVVGGNWTVAFNTTGTANLTISAVNGTTWGIGNESVGKDLEFLDLRCGSDFVNYNWVDDSVFVENYSCNETGYETSKVLTEGAHHLEFNFGGYKAYAHNWADNGSLVQFVTTCGTLSTTNATYILINSTITNVTGTCFTITGNNVTFDLSGYTIDGDDSGADYGIYSNSRDNLKIMNGTITDFYDGLYLASDVDYSLVANLESSSCTDAGFNFDGFSEYNVFENLTFRYNAYGIYYSMVPHGYNVFNNITVESTLAIGVTIGGDEANFSNFRIWNSSTSGAYTGIYVGGSNNSFKNGYVNQSGNYGIYFESSGGALVYGNLFQDVWVNGSTGADVYYFTDGAGSGAPNNTFLNVSLTSQNITFNNNTNGGNSEFVRQWYVGVQVNGTSGYLSGANVNVTNSSGGRVYSGTTDSNGQVPRFGLTEYTIYGGSSPVTTYSTPHQINISKTGYVTNSTFYNLSVNKNMNHSIVLLAIEELTACGTLDQSNATYVLLNNISTTGTCFTIGANNVTLDLSGFTIDGDDGGSDNGVESAGYNQTTIKNGTIIDFGFGIYFSRNNNNTLNNLNINSSAVQGIVLLISSNNTVKNIVTQSNSQTGIYLNSFSDGNFLENITSKFNVIEGIKISSSSNNSFYNLTSISDFYGVYFSSGSNSNNFSDVFINRSTIGFFIGSGRENNVHNLTLKNIAQSGLRFSTNANGNNISEFSMWNVSYSSSVTDGIYFDESSDNIVENGYINLSGGYGVRFFSNSGRRSSNNTLKNIWINHTGAEVYFYLDNAGSGALNNTFLNVTFGEENITFYRGITGGNMELIRQWYADIRVNDSSGYLASANVNITNSSGANVFSGTTDATGQVSRQILTEYKVYGTNFTANKTYSTPHQINISKAGYLSSSTFYNLTSTNNLNINEVLSFGALTSCGTLSQSNVTYVLLNNISTTGTCFTIGANNVTLNLNGYTVDGDDTGYPYGVNLSGYNQTTITNGTFTDFFYGIYLYNGANNNIIKDINSNSNTGHGIYLYLVRNNSLINLEAISNTQSGVFIYSTAIIRSNNTLENITSNSNQHGIYFRENYGGVIKNARASLNSQNGLYLERASNNSIWDSNFSQNTQYGVNSDDSFNNTLVNTTFSGNSFANVVFTTTSELIRQWYADIEVNDSSGYLSSANVNITNSSGANVFSGTTNATGRVARQILTEYKAYGTNFTANKTYSTPHQINISKNLYYSNSTSYNLTATQNLNINTILSLGGVTACGTLSQSNTTYVLLNNISTTTTCFTIGANNVTLDLSGFTVDGDDTGTDYGVTSVGYNQTTIKNGTITDFDTGIYLLGSLNNVVFNLSSNSNVNNGIKVDTNSDNNIFTNLTLNSNQQGFWVKSANNSFVEINANPNGGNAGIYLDVGSSNNSLQNIFVNSTGSYGIWVYSTNFNNITGAILNYVDFGIAFEFASHNTATNITMNSNSYNGLYFNGYTFSPTTENNTIRDFRIWNSSLSSGEGGLTILVSRGNTFENGYINQSEFSGIYLRSNQVVEVSNNTFQNIWINNTIGAEIYFYTDNAGSGALNNTFLNVTLSSQNITFVNNTDGGNMELIRQWYADIHITNSSGDLLNASINVTNVTSNNIFSSFTNATGQVARQILTEYFMYGGSSPTTTYSTPHIFTTEKSGYTTSTVTYNLSSTRNVNHAITLSVPTPTPPSSGGSTTPTPVVPVVPTCTDACTSGATEKRCSSGVPQQRTCGTGSDGCTTWGSWTNLASCTGGYVCSSGVCIPPTCTDECSSGQTQKECVNELSSKTRTCGNYDADSCLEFSNWTSTLCASNEFCDVNSCVPRCAENWVCGVWSACADSKQTRTCNDLNNCGTILLKPNLTQSCLSGIEITSSPTDSNLLVSSKDTIAFKVNVKDLANIASISVEWLLKSVSQKKDTGVGSLSSSFTSPSNTSGEVKAKISVDGKSQEVSWDIQINEEAKEACQTSWHCEWTSCEEGDDYKYPFDCVDLNDCGVSSNKPEQKECTCHSKLNCSEWTSCDAVYSIDDVLQGKKSVRGFQERLCQDLNKCESESTQTKPCDLTVPVVSKTVNWCGENYVELYEEGTDKLVSRIKTFEISEVSSKNFVDVSLIKTSLQGYCNYCYDGEKNHDEENLDCGGPSCPACVAIQKVPAWRNWIVSFSWLVFALFFSSFLFVSRSNIAVGAGYLVKMYHARRLNEEMFEKAIEEFFRKLLHRKKSKEIKEEIKKPLSVEKKIKKEIKEFEKEEKPKLPKKKISLLKKNLIKQAISRWNARKKRIEEDKRTLSAISEAKGNIGRTMSLVSEVEAHADKKSYMHLVKESLKKIQLKRRQRQIVKSEFKDELRRLKKQKKEELKAISHEEKTKVLDSSLIKRSISKMSLTREKLRNALNSEKRIRKRKLSQEFKEKIKELKEKEKAKLNSLIRKDKVQKINLDNAEGLKSKAEVKTQLSDISDLSKKLKKGKKTLPKISEADKDRLNVFSKKEKIEILEDKKRLTSAKKDVTSIAKEIRKKFEFK